MCLHLGGDVSVFVDMLAVSGVSVNGLNTRGMIMTSVSLFLCVCLYVFVHACVCVYVFVCVWGRYWMC